MTRKFYRPRGDVHVPARWHLHDPITDEGYQSWEFRRGRPVTLRSTPDIDVQIAGIPLDFTLAGVAVPLASAHLADALAAIAGPDFQRIPVTVNGARGHDIVNATRLIQCVDEDRSDFMRWTERDHRRDLADQYRMFTKLRIDPARVPEGVHLFRIALWDIALIVSEELMEAARSICTVGPVFQPTFDL